MAPKTNSKPFNPFYPLLVLLGVVFCITACAYGVMTVKGLQPEAAMSHDTESAKQLLVWLDLNGFQLMMIELAALAAATVAAIGTDEFWERRHRVAQAAVVPDESTSLAPELGEPLE